jgi:carbamoyltransferase
MIVVGINSSGYISSAAFVIDGKLVFACPEERLDRQKQSKSFPLKAIQAGLEYLNIALSDIDCFAIGYNPAISVGSRTRTGFSEWPGYPGARFYSNPNYLLPLLGNTDFSETKQVFERFNGEKTTIRYVTHHLSHMSNAFFLSQYPEAAIFSCDGYGEKATTVWGKGSIKDGIEVIKKIEFPHSIGSLYGSFTQFLGYKPDGDEWKVMGAAAYGDPNTYYNKIRSLINWDNNGLYEIDLSYFQYFDFDSSPMYLPKFEELFFKHRSSHEPFEKKHYDLAASLQKVVEEYLLTAINWLYRETKSSSLCLTGGVAMNSVFNGKASLLSPFKRIYIPYSPDDSGNSIGAALWVASKEKQKIIYDSNFSSPYLGRSYDDEEIEKILARYGLIYKREHNIEKTVAKKLAKGQVIGWFQGPMEFGQRALGNRSILADPRDPNMKDKINKAVKYREAFRPFAPSILEEHQKEYFEVEDFIPVPYMEKVLPIRKEMQKLIPAVVHADGTGRLQTVNKSANPLYYSLIEEFKRITNIPIVLNTSFNTNGEPVVESPTDAIRTFHSSGLDALAIGSFLVEKKHQKTGCDQNELQYLFQTEGQTN